MQIKAFKLGGDFHSRTAMAMYDYVAEAIESGEVQLEVGSETVVGGPPPVLLKDKFSIERTKVCILGWRV